MTLTPSSSTGGYLLVADELELPATGSYAWQAEATDDNGFTEVVAEGTLSVSFRLSQAA